jgi:ketosteroid isomerase-like protein
MTSILTWESMKKTALAFAVLLAAAHLFLGSSAQGAEDSGSAWEQEIRAAEKLHLKAFLDKDMTALDSLVSDDFVVNSPRNSVITKQQLLGMVRDGVLAISSFDQAIEAVRRFGDIVTVMGEDRLTYIAPSPNAGQTHRRRFTDIWRRQDGRWRFIARQASLICP